MFDHCEEDEEIEEEDECDDEHLSSAFHQNRPSPIETGEGKQDNHRDGLDEENTMEEDGHQEDANEITSYESDEMEPTRPQ